MDSQNPEVGSSLFCSVVARAAVVVSYTKPVQVVSSYSMSCQFVVNFKISHFFLSCIVGMNLCVLSRLTYTM